MMLCKLLQEVRLPIVRYGTRNGVQAVRGFSVQQSNLPVSRRMDRYFTGQTFNKRQGWNKSLQCLESNSMFRNSSNQFDFMNCSTFNHMLIKRFKSDSQKPTDKGESLTIMQKFKKAYKEHGKVLIVVHVTTYCMWFGSFYYAASMGLDVIPLMERLGFSETIIKPFRASGLGNLAVAFLLCKLISPVRYGTTLGGTSLVIRYLRNQGKVISKQEQKTLTKAARKEVGDKIKLRQVAFKDKMRTFGGLQKRMNVRLKDMRKKGRSRLRLINSRFIGRVKKSNLSMREKTKILQKKANLRFEDLTKSGKSRLRVTTSKFISRVRRRKKTNGSQKQK